VQALGRARGVNRTAETPLDIDIVSDVVLPISVDQVLEWSEVPTGAEIEMLADGIVLESPTDMAACWPEVWETPEGGPPMAEPVHKRAKPYREYLI
jgi:putative DNA primase/helicase